MNPLTREGSWSTGVDPSRPNGTFAPARQDATHGHARTHAQTLRAEETGLQNQYEQAARQGSERVERGGGDGNSTPALTGPDAARSRKKAPPGLQEVIFVSRKQRPERRSSGLPQRTSTF